MKRRTKQVAARPAFDIAGELMRFDPDYWANPRDPADDVPIAPFRRWQQARRDFAKKHGLPPNWFAFHRWRPTAQRRYLEAGGTPPPPNPVVDR